MDIAQIEKSRSMRVMSKVSIKRFDKMIPLPEYKTTGAAGFDLSAREDVVILPHTISLVPLNVAIAIPKGHCAILVPRSSLHKRGLMSANNVGIIDRDYCGNDDEWKAPLYNFTDTVVSIAKGERIMQGVFLPVTHAEFREVDTLDHPSRGGFGTTGTN
jgi:dUTP pyrophosphatase